MDKQQDSPAQPAHIEQVQRAGAHSPDAFRKAIEQQDHTALMQVFTPNIVFHSPIVHRDYIGRDAIGLLLAAVMEVFQDFVYTGEFNAPDGKVLRFRARVGERDLDGVDILTFDPDGLVRELTVMVRPYSAATALRDAMAAKLAEVSKGPATP